MQCMLALQGSYLGANGIVTTIAAHKTSIQGVYHGFGNLTAKDLMWP